MITLPLSTAQFVVAVFILAPAVCALVTWTTNRIDSRAQRAAWKSQEKDLAARSHYLDSWIEIVDARSASVTQREEAVAEREHELHARAQQAHATLDSEAENFDTMISLLDWELPNPREWDDTVALPAVEDDE